MPTQGTLATVSPLESGGGCLYYFGNGTFPARSSLVSAGVSILAATAQGRLKLDGGLLSWQLLWLVVAVDIGRSHVTRVTRGHH